MKVWLISPLYICLSFVSYKETWIVPSGAHVFVCHSACEELFSILVRVFSKYVPYVCIKSWQLIQLQLLNIQTQI